MLLASLRHIREIGPGSNICCLTAFEPFLFFFFFFICLFLRSGIYPEFKNWQVLIIWIGITVQQGIHVPAELSLKANLYYQLHEVISRDCNIFQLQILHLDCSSSSPEMSSPFPTQCPDPWACSLMWIHTEPQKKRHCKVENLTWIY